MTETKCWMLYLIFVDVDTELCKCWNDDRLFKLFVQHTNFIKVKEWNILSAFKQG